MPIVRIGLLAADLGGLAQVVFLDFQIACHLGAIADRIDLPARPAGDELDLVVVAFFDPYLHAVVVARLRALVHGIVVRHPAERLAIVAALRHGMRYQQRKRHCRTGG